MESNKFNAESILADRAVIPRWKPPHQAVETHNASSEIIARREKIGSSWISRLEGRYGQTQSRFDENDLVETATLYGKSERFPEHLKVTGATRVSISPTDATFRDSLVLGESVDVHEQRSRGEISRLRKAVADDPDRPFCWSELSRHYLVVGQKKKAAQCMHAALKLSKNNIYLKRAAARLFVHVEDIDLSLYLLRSAPSFRHDPWLLAAELATTSMIQGKSRFVDDAQRLLASGKFSDRETSELAAALGTVELENGSIKRAKALFGASLSDPTENSLAQAQWACERESKIVIPTSAWLTPEPHEARTLASRHQHEWHDALQTCAAWLADEPFSVRPALMGSYLGFRPEHTSMAEQFATAGLRCDSSNFMLLNNRAVARAYQGKIKEAYSDVSAALQYRDARNDAHLMATLGLIAYRSGQPELGRSYYGLSIAWFKHLKDRMSIFSAILHQLREEIRHNSSSIDLAIDMARRVKQSPFVVGRPELVGLADLVLQEASELLENQSDYFGSTYSSHIDVDDFIRQAHLFKIPDVAKQHIAKLNDYPRFFLLPPSF